MRRPLPLADKAQVLVSNLSLLSSASALSSLSTTNLSPTSLPHHPVIPDMRTRMSRA